MEDVLPDKGLLDGGQLPVLLKPFDGRDDPAGRRSDRYLTDGIRLVAH
jgi:hypothetical protein